MLDWAKRNWYWLAGGAVIVGGAALALRQRRTLGAFAACESAHKPLVSGPAGEIVGYVRLTGRCPACDFLEAAPKPIQKKIGRTFEEITERGLDIMHPLKFKPLSGESIGKGLWEIKEFDHRIYAVREPLPARKLRVTLLRGWVKDKATRNLEERRQIGSAQAMREEYEARCGA